MNLLRSIWMAFSMFSRFPTPKVEWEADSMAYMLAAFPLVGCVIGLLLWAWIWVCGALSLGTALYAAGLTLIPVAATGGIHLDGFCDVVDALASHGDKKRKRAILKDPHAGAFAVIGVCAYMLMYFALCTELAPKRGVLLCLAHVLARAVSGLAGLCFPTAGSGLLHTFSQSAKKKASAGILLGWFVLGVAAASLLHPATGLAMGASALACAGGVYRMSVRQFGGMSGDLAGYLLQSGELIMLFSIVCIGKAGI